VLYVVLVGAGEALIGDWGWDQLRDHTHRQQAKSGNIGSF
jgi:hypothetical protein